MLFTEGGDTEKLIRRLERIVHEGERFGIYEKAL